MDDTRTEPAPAAEAPRTYARLPAAAATAPFKRRATLGNLEIGYVETKPPLLAVRRAGVVIQTLRIDGKVMGMVRRGGDVHVVMCDLKSLVGPLSNDSGWRVVIIHPDGSYGERWSNSQPRRGWDKAVATYSGSFERFGLRGTGMMSGDFLVEDPTWRWDAKKGEYMMSSKSSAQLCFQ